MLEIFRDNRTIQTLVENIEISCQVDDLQVVLHLSEVDIRYDDRVHLSQTNAVLCQEGPQHGGVTGGLAVTADEAEVGQSVGLTEGPELSRDLRTVGRPAHLSPRLDHLETLCDRN